MNFAPYQWRADGGYLPPPGAIAVPLAQTMAAPVAAPLQCGWPGLQYVRGPVPVCGITSYPGPYLASFPYQLDTSWPPRASIIPPLPPPPTKPSGKSKHTSKEKTSKYGNGKSDATSFHFDRSIATLSSVLVGESSGGKSATVARRASRTVAPPPPPPPPAGSTVPKIIAVLPNYTPDALPPGVNYLFSRQRTRVHIFNKARRLWENKYRGLQPEFKIFSVATSVTAKELIASVVMQGNQDDDDGAVTDKACHQWALTEVVEMGGGEWKKGVTIPYASDKAEKTLSSLGWDARRGGKDMRPPVWLTVHQG